MTKLGSLLWRPIRFELRIYAALARWVFRRPAVPAGADVIAFGYGQGVVPVLWLWVFASVAEIPVVHVLLPWQTAQVIAFLVSAWGLAWMLGFLASHKVYPHLLMADALVVRHGPPPGSRCRGPRSRTSGPNGVTCPRPPAPTNR